MGIFSHILDAIPILFQWHNILAMIVGTAAGIAIGALPGLSAAMGVALLVPYTFVMSPETGLVMLAGVYNGAIYGGSISAILLRIPGTPAAIATTLDGYPLTCKGRADEALQLSVSGSTIGGIFSAIALIFLAPPLAEVALSFGPPEYFWLAVLGLTIVASLSSGSVVKGFITACFGLFLGVVGLDPITARERFTFGQVGLLGGIDVTSALIGLYSIPQVLRLARTKDKVEGLAEGALAVVKRRMFEDIGKYWKTVVRSSILGVIIGMIPAAGANIAAIVGYNEAKRASKHPELFGTGYGEGVVAPETANNAVTGGSLVPLLTLGIPGNAVAAVMVGALLIHGLVVGPELFTKSADIVYTFMLAMLFTNIIMLFMGFYGARRVFINVTKIPNSVLAPAIVVLCVIGSYSLRNSMFDVWVMLILGFIGYVFEENGYPLAPAVLAIILGPMAEANLRRSIMMGRGSVIPLFTRPICIVVIILCVLSLLTPYFQARKKKASDARTS